MQKLSMIQQLKRISNKLVFTIATLDALCLYLFIDSTHQIVYFALSIIFAIPLLLKPKYIIWTIIVFVVAYIVRVFCGESHTNGYISTKDHLRVIKTTSMGPIVDYHGSNIFIRSKDAYSQGDFISLTGKIESIENTNDFDIKTYFKTLNVVDQVRFPHYIKHIAYTSDIRVDIKSYVLNGGENYNKVTPLLLLGMKTSESREIYNTSIRMNIVHLFVISGFHISLFYLIVSKILKTMKLNEKASSWISLIPIFIYLFVLGFPISATRATMLVTFSVINKQVLKSKFSTITILSITMSIMFVYKPWTIYSLSFIFTYVATYMVILVNMFKFKNKFRKFGWITTMAFLSNLLIVIYINHFYSVFGLIYGVVLSPLFVVMYSLTLFLFPLKGLMEYIDQAFIILLNLFNKTNILINVPSFSINYLLLFYGITLSSIIILITWNLYTDKKGSLSTKRLIS